MYEPLRDPLSSFTNREDILAQFEQFLRVAQSGQFRLLAIKGNSGTGKTLLIEYLTSYICPSLNWLTGQINFSQSQSDFRSILTEIEDALKGCVSRQSLKEYRARRDEYNRSFDSYCSFFNISQNVEAKEYSSVSKINLSMQVNAQLRERERQLRAEWSRALIELAEESEHPLCLFIDSYVSPHEADSELDRWLWEEILLKLARAAPQPVQIVVCGWEWPGNASIVPFSSFRQLDDFNQANVKAYLEKQEVITPKISGNEQDELVAPFFELTKGHPLVLSLAVAYFNELEPFERTAQSLRVDRPLIDEKARIAFLEERLLSRLHEPYHTLLMWGPVLRFFNQATLQAIMDIGNENITDGASKLNDRIYDRFLRYPFIRQLKTSISESGYIQFIFHELVRQVGLSALHRHHPETEEQLHRRTANYYWRAYWDFIEAGYEQEVADLQAHTRPEVAEWFIKRPEQITRIVPEEAFRMLLEYFYHALQVKEFQVDAFERWKGLTRGALYRWQHRRANLLLDIVRQLMDEGNLFLKRNERNFSQYLMLYAMFLVREARLEEARKLVKTATMFLENLEDSYEGGVHLADIGQIYLSLGELDQALNYFKRAAAVAEKEAHSYNIGASLNYLGLVYQEQNRLEEALSCFQRALAIIKQEGDSNQIARNLYNIGLVLQQQGHLTQAMNYYEQALDRVDEKGNLSDIARYLTKIGSIYREQRDFNLAMEYYERAINISKQIGDLVTLSTCLGDLGMIYAALGKLGKALQCYQQSLALTVQVGIPHEFAIIHHNIGDIYAQRGQYRRAIASYIKSLNFYEQLGQGYASDVTEELERIALCYRFLGEIVKAVSYDLRAQQLRKKGRQFQ